MSTRNWQPAVDRPVGAGGRLAAAGLRSALGLASLLVACAFSGCWSEAEEEIRLQGTVERADVAVTTALAGRVAMVHVEVGDEVAQGDPLLSLDTQLVEAQRDEARAVVAAAEAEFERLLAGPRPEELKVAEAEVALAKARWQQVQEAGSAAIAPGQPTGTWVAGSPGGAGGGQADETTSQAAAAVATAEAKLAMLREWPSTAELARAEASLRQAEAALAALEERLRQSHLTSPIRGRVVERLAQPGEVVPAGAVVMRLADPATVTVRVYVPEGDVAMLELDDEAHVESDAYRGEVFRGRISYIADEAEFTPRYVQTAEQRSGLVFGVTVTVENEGGRLKPGMPVTVRFARR